MYEKVADRWPFHFFYSCMFSGLVRRRDGDPRHRQPLPVAACVHALAPLFMSFGSSSGDEGP